MTGVDPGKILIVDDDNRNLMVLEALLAELGPELVSARSGEEALRKLLSGEYAVILLDVQMPGLDGYETARLIRERERYSTTPIIFLTANSVDFAQVMRGYEVGAVDFMLKPIEPTILKSKVQVFIDLFNKTEQVRRQSERLRSLELRAHQQELAIEKARKAEELARTNEQLATMTRAMTTFLSERSWLAASQQLLAGALELTHSRAGFIATAVDDGTARVWAVQGWPGFIEPTTDKARAKGLEGWNPAGRRSDALRQLVSAGHPLSCSDPCDEPGLAPLVEGIAGMRNLVLVPVAGADGSVGMLGVAGRDEPYDEESQDALGALARTAGVLFESSRQLQREKHLSEQLRQAQKMEAIGNLAGGIAHDFNNLLTVIQGYVSFLLSSMGERDSQREYAQAIQEAASQAAWLTRQLLAFSRKQVLQPRIIDVNTLAGTTEKMLRRVIGEHIQLVTHLSRDLGRVKADPAQLEQVLMNLSVNARDAMPEGGQLIIRTANIVVGPGDHEDLPQGEYVLVEVTDTGVGMDEDTRQRVFEPFFTTKEPGKGTGLGLATVYGIVQQSGGQISVTSERGRGTTFRVWLPRVEEAESVPDVVVPRPLSVAITSDTVLLVEDERPVRTLARRILEQAGYRVLEAPSGDDALEICDRHDGPIQLLLTDMVMPGMNGRELAERAASRRPEMKILYMSGYMDEMLGSITAAERETLFLEKPFSPDGMVRKVRQLLDGTALPAMAASDQVARNIPTR